MISCSHGNTWLIPSLRHNPKTSNPDWNSEIKVIIRYLREIMAGIEGNILTFLALKIGAASGRLPSHNLRSFSLPPVATSKGVSGLADIV